MADGVQLLLADGAHATFGLELKTAVAAFLVGIAVGITGMGGGALMTPALIFLGVGDTSAVVTADLTAAAVSSSGGAAMHWRSGSPNLELARWLIVGSVPMAFIGPFVVNRLLPPTAPSSTGSCSSASASPCCSRPRRTRCGSTSSCAGVPSGTHSARATPSSARSRPSWSGRSAGCSSASPRWAPARSS